MSEKLAYLVLIVPAVRGSFGILGQKSKTATISGMLWGARLSKVVNNSSL